MNNDEQLSPVTGGPVKHDLNPHGQETYLRTHIIITSTPVNNKQLTYSIVGVCQVLSAKIEAHTADWI